ncbi:uncharacterized protein LOC131681392 [Topomyia yanbarensis]|uniref:uncharacterized protein LOC131681392 n=1 Tax=Topomyia yanbarensis TaxID=2498891 RepID=UPI00273CA806|nr:uncharacterized protein LOC131681392 [Topomyia yanbarensis]
MVQYASLYNDYVPYQSERPFKLDNRTFLRRWDELNGMKWIPASNGEIPPGAIQAGRVGKHKLYVGRAEIMTSIAPGAVIAEKKACLVPWGGKCHKRQKYEVLCTPGHFVPVKSSNTLLRGTPGGISEQGEPLYIGRMQHEGKLINGKIQRSYFWCYLPYKGKEVEGQIFESEIFVKA